MVRAMRFLHTSDWHLGRSLHRADLRDAQARFLDHLVETTRAERAGVTLPEWLVLDADAGSAGDLRKLGGAAGNNAAVIGC